MTDQEFLDRINKYSEEVLKDIDPQNTKISAQLDKLMPVMNDLAKEINIPLEDVFIRYMDLASMQKVDMNEKFKQTMADAGVTDLGSNAF